MKSALIWLVGIACAAGTGLYGFQQLRNVQSEAAYEARLAALKSDFLIRSSGLHLIEREAYPEEVRATLARYFRELELLAVDFPEQFDLHRKRDEVVAKLDAGRMDEIQKAQRDERIAFTLDLFETLRSGAYRPLYSQVDKTFRFDILDVQPSTFGMEPRLQMSFIHWGAFGEVRYNSIEGVFRPESTEKQPVAIPKIIANGQPPALQIDPERWVHEFIPGVEIGYYDFPLFPAKADSMTLSFSYTLETVGGISLPVDLTFPTISIRDAWKVGADETWQRQERKLTQDELRAEGALP